MIFAWRRPPVPKREGLPIMKCMSCKAGWAWTPPLEDDRLSRGKTQHYPLSQWNPLSVPANPATPASTKVQPPSTSRSTPRKEPPHIPQNLCSRILAYRNTGCNRVSGQGYELSKKARSRTGTGPFHHPSETYDMVRRPRPKCWPTNLPRVGADLSGAKTAGRDRPAWNAVR